MVIRYTNIQPLNSGASNKFHYQSFINSYFLIYTSKHSAAYLLPPALSPAALLCSFVHFTFVASVVNFEHFIVHLFVRLAIPCSSCPEMFASTISICAQPSAKCCSSSTRARPPARSMSICMYALANVCIY